MRLGRNKRNQRIIIPVMIMITLCRPITTSACELLYAGGNMTDDGANMFMRSEELGADDTLAVGFSGGVDSSQAFGIQGAVELHLERQLLLYPVIKNPFDNIPSQGI